MNLSPEEKDRFDNLSTSDQLKLEKIFSMMQAEKNKANDPKSAVVDRAGNTSKFAKGEMAENGEPKDYTEEIAEGATDFISLDNETANHIESLLSIPLKKKFLDNALDLIQDLWEDTPFDAEDVVTHLANEIMNMLDGWQEQGDRLAGLEENHAMQGTEAELEAGEIGNMDALTEEIGPTGIAITDKQLDSLKKLGAISGLEVYVQDKDGSNVRKVDYTLTNTNFEKDPDDIDYIDENEGQEELKEHFNRFMFKKYQ
jgi:hypothetical protein